MNRSKVALIAIVASALTCGLGCGDGGQKTGASAEPAKSGAAAAASGAAKGSAAAVAATAAPSKPADAMASGADVLKHMPKECEEGRVFVSLNKFFGGDQGAGFETLLGQAMAKEKEGKKAEEVMKALKDGGIDPLKDGRDIAVCANKDDKKVVVAVSFESKAENPAETIAKAMEVGDGKAPTKEEKDGVTYLVGSKPDKVMAIVGKNIMLIGEDRALLETVAKGGDGAAEFGDAKSHVVWAKITGKEPVDVTMKEAGDDFDLKINAMAGSKAPQMKEQFEKMMPELDKLAEKAPFMKPLLPIAKNGKVEVEGEKIVFTTKFPKTAIGNFISEASKMKPEELMRGLKF